MADMRFATADQVLINVAMCMVLPIVRPDPDEELLRALAHEALGKGNPDNPLMRPIIDALRILLAAPSGDARLRSSEQFARQSAMWDLQRAVHKVARQRLAGAVEAHRQQNGVPV